MTSDYTYTLETIISAGHRRMGIASVPISTNEKLRESRLFGSIRKYVTRSATTIIRIYTMYKPLRVFLSLGTFFMLLGLIIGIRFLIFYFKGQGTGHIQSLIFMTVFFSMGFQLVIFGMLADLIANNRKLNEKILTKVRKIDADIDKSNFLYLNNTCQGMDLTQKRRKMRDIK